MNKKLLVLLLALCLAFGLAACSQNAEQTDLPAEEEVPVDPDVTLGKFDMPDIRFFDASLLDGLYARASLFAFPSLYDVAPMVVREAAVMGTPSVTEFDSVHSTCLFGRLQLR